MQPTSSQTVGPFFHDALITGEAQRILAAPGARGERIYIEGTVYDGDGLPVPDALVEIWQADAAGRFPHPADPEYRLADPAFRGFGRSDTANDGRFHFETIRPGRRTGPDGDGHAPHVNVRVFGRGLLVHLVTRLYFEDEPTNATDPVLAQIALDRRSSLLARRVADGPPPCYQFDIRLQGTGETVFFDL
ncbi:protocatechuate 3,4-dioxygenase subunit alpha [Rhodocaloribacter litoris]|uniref:protocatechuate 3,4-dioxygenase subunit alpha n=1 Tax=Rhodocaloribacter litoris TaxID=2558931 RepID=UPI001424109B|nr:protocatechuate 3,4-dioxygenase subunit alpha [Rhodocaloribacter litoris]QXD15401.1 protocatechuate 3,4-dioxygenase subunit alpha [Rhodocaloribacter litoris]